MENSKSKTTPTAYLVINSQIFPLKNKITRIGRKLDNDLVIQDPLISRHHVEIHRETGNYTLVDLDSTTGTHIEDKRITRQQLKSGDLFSLANIPIMFIIDSPTLQDGHNIVTGSLPREDL